MNKTLQMPSIKCEIPLRRGLFRIFLPYYEGKAKVLFKCEKLSCFDLWTIALLSSIMPFLMRGTGPLETF